MSEPECKKCPEEDADLCMMKRLTPGHYSDEFWLGAPDTCYCACHGREPGDD